MQNQTTDINRRKEIIDICLKKFIEKGLYETTARDLSNALKMQPSGLYYHFQSKDDIVLECAEEAEIRLEEALLLPVLRTLNNLEEFGANDEKNAEDMNAMMQFFAQVCTANRYKEKMKPILQRMRKRQLEYCEESAGKLNCTAMELAPWFFACLVFSESYMIFGEEAFSVKPLDFMNAAIRQFREKRIIKTTEESDE